VYIDRPDTKIATQCIMYVTIINNETMYLPTNLFNKMQFITVTKSPVYFGTGVPHSGSYMIKYMI